MSTSITTFPFSADKISELPVVTSILGTDKVLVNASSVTSTITKTNLISDLDFQPHSDNLDLYDSIPPTEEALFLINTLITPEVSSYLRINSGTGQTLGRTPTQVLSDIAAQPRNANLDEFATVNPGLPGKNILRLDAPSVSGYVMVNAGIDSDAFIRTPAQVRSDIGAFATASLDDDTSLGGLLASAGKAPSQRAAKKYIDSRAGITTGVSDDTLASSATLALDATNGDQITITGSIGVTTITLAEKEQRTLVFDSALIITADANLVLPGGLTTLTTDAGGYATVLGGAGSLVTITDYQSSARGTIANIIGGTIAGVAITNASVKLTTGAGLVLVSSTDTGGGNTRITSGSTHSVPRTLTLNINDGNRLASIAGDITLAGAFTTAGAFGMTLTATATTSATLPAGTTTLAGLVGVPGSAVATGIAGTFSYDATHFYVCISANTWVRDTLATW